MNRACLLYTSIEAFFRLRMLATRVIQDRHAEPEVGALRQRHTCLLYTSDR